MFYETSACELQTRPAAKFDMAMRKDILISTE